ncbi:MAG TPA: orotidine-5'-phosphate decarboxylase [Phycisphaerales bacterium]|nr:orotidine-5'-phosphate decarboxylase [Phycisphaerales bacterium]
MTTAATHFADRLASALDRAGSPACVGLDPVLERLPEAVRAEHWEPVRAITAFCKAVIDAAAPHVAVVKPQSACFERYGSAGVHALERVVEHAREKGLIVILDAKRGDIGVTAEHYAAAAAHTGAHAITVNAYLGPSTVEPYLAAGLGVFVLVRTSNPDSDLVQAPMLDEGMNVAAMMGAHVRVLGRGHVGACGLSDAGAVVGATKAADGRTLRAIMPEQVFLVPGYGAQGGSAADVRALLRPGAAGPGSSGVVVNASRSVIYPAGAASDWRQAIAEAAAAFARDIRSIVA